MKKLLSSMAVFSLLILIGAGCTNDDDTNQNGSDLSASINVTGQQATTAAVKAEEKPPEVKDEIKPEAITLKAEAIGGSQVKLQWELPTGMTQPPVFRIVRGPRENPTSPGSFYYNVAGNKRDIIWGRLPKGKLNFRICVLKENKCETYSNNVVVEVK